MLDSPVSSVKTMILSYKAASRNFWKAIVLFVSYPRSIYGEIKERRSAMLEPPNLSELISSHVFKVQKFRLKINI
jgi:hypothetical protein